MSYHQQWQRVAENGASYYNIWLEDHPSRPKSTQNSYYREPPPCSHCCFHCGRDGNHVALLLHRLGLGLKFLANLDGLFAICSHTNNPCRDKFHSWRSSIEENIKNIQPFDTRLVSSVSSATQRYVALMSFSTNFLIQSSVIRSPVTSSSELSDQPVSACCKCWIIERQIPISLATYCTSLCARFRCQISVQ